MLHHYCRLIGEISETYTHRKSGRHVMNQAAVKPSFVLFITLGGRLEMLP